MLILKMEEDTQHFWFIVLYILRQVKTQLKCKKKKFVQWLEKVL